MTKLDDLDSSIDVEVIRISDKGTVTVIDPVATEIPLTIEANGQEIATLLTSPADLKELVCGYLFTSGFIRIIDEVKQFSCDKIKWIASVEIEHTPDPALMQKRLYTSGCGKCAMYTNVNELSMRHKLDNDMTITSDSIFRLARLIGDGTPLFNKTGAVHSAILANSKTDTMIIMNDVARHNAVDKAIGHALLTGRDLTQCILARTGRTSSEIVYKTRKSGIAITIARGAPTHQAMHLARDMGITLIGFARERSFNIYSGRERVLL
jgi:FdhD protein